MNWLWQQERGSQPLFRRKDLRELAEERESHANVGKASALSTAGRNLGLEETTQAQVTNHPLKACIEMLKHSMAC